VIVFRRWELRETGIWGDIRICFVYIMVSLFGVLCGSMVDDEDGF